MNSIKAKQHKAATPMRSPKRALHTHNKPLTKSLKANRRCQSPSMPPSKHRRFATATDSPQAQTSTQPQVVFESPLDKRERLLTLGVLGLGAFASLQVTAGLLYSPDSSLVVPALTTATAIGVTGYLRRVWQHRVTQIVVRGPDDPVEITTPGLFTQNVTTKIPRQHFPGLPINFDSRVFFDAKRPFICLVRSGKSIKTYMLNRAGLFDSSGPLNALLGYDVITFDRCAPSLPYQPLPQTQPTSQVRKEQQQQQRDV